jgi:general secretion pathway protein B
VHSARHADAGPVLNDDPPDDQEMLPSISELNLTGTQSLPDIHLDVHVYATRSADRFVYINMRKYREGAVLQEGPTLERIRRDGVVLNYNGLRFLVPRQ